MDMIRTGKFIAELRKKKNMTQEQLGDDLGVTNKTVSRWETGTYMPPADILLKMSECFEVSINEILSGRFLTADEYKEAAEKNLQQAIKVSPFSLREKMDFCRKKWLKEHVSIMILMGAGIAGFLIAGIFLKNAVMVSLTPILFLLAHCWRNNTMMAYVEARAFDGQGPDSSM